MKKRKRKAKTALTKRLEIVRRELRGEFQMELVRRMDLRRHNENQRIEALQKHIENNLEDFDIRLTRCEESIRRLVTAHEKAPQD